MGTLSEDDDEQDQSTTQEHEVEVENEPAAEQQDPPIEVVEEDARIAAPDDDGEQQHDNRGERKPRESAKERRERARVAKERDKKELAFLRAELSRQDQAMRDLQSAQSVTRINELDNRMSVAQREVQTFEQIEAAAIAKNEGRDAVDARKLRQEAERKLQQAAWEKQQIQQQRQAPPPPTFLPLAQEFLSKLPWYDANGNDEDSLIVRALDNAVAQRYNPNSPEYWSELEGRVKQTLRHRFQTQQNNNSDDDSEEDVVQDQPPRRKGPPTGGSTRTASSPNRIMLSPERVQAMREAGAWDDPVLRARMAKAYANYDKQHNSRG